MAAAVVTSCGSSAVAPSQTNAPRGGDPVDGRVLFIGNSLTEANGLPGARRDVVSPGRRNADQHSQRGLRRVQPRRPLESGRGAAPNCGRQLVDRRAPAGTILAPGVAGRTARVDRPFRRSHSRDGRADGALHGVAGIESPRGIRFRQPVVRASRRRRRRHAVPRGRGVARSLAHDPDVPAGRRGRVSSDSHGHVPGGAGHLSADHRSIAGGPSRGMAIPTDRALLLQEAAQEANAQFGRRESPGWGAVRRQTVYWLPLREPGGTTPLAR